MKGTDPKHRDSEKPDQAAFKSRVRALTRQMEEAMRQPPKMNAEEYRAFKLKLLWPSQFKQDRPQQ